MQMHDFAMDIGMLATQLRAERTLITIDPQTNAMVVRGPSFVLDLAADLYEKAKLRFQDVGFTLTLEDSHV